MEKKANNQQIKHGDKQKKRTAGCKFTHQLGWGAVVVSAANRNRLALSVLSLFQTVKETDFTNDSLGHLFL